MDLERKRPTGVTIIAVLTIIGGIIALIVGIALVALAPLLSQLNVSDGSNTFNDSIFMGMLGALLIVLGIASFVVAWGLLKGKGWAWIVAIILSIISIATSIISLVAGQGGSVGSIIINGVILYYLNRSNVKSYFGRIKAPAA